MKRKISTVNTAKPDVLDLRQELASILDNSTGDAKHIQLLNPLYSEEFNINELTLNNQELSSSTSAGFPTPVTSISESSLLEKKLMDTLQAYNTIKDCLSKATIPDLKMSLELQKKQLSLKAVELKNQILSLSQGLNTVSKKPNQPTFFTTNSNWQENVPTKTVGAETNDSAVSTRLSTELYTVRKRRRRAGKERPEDAYTSQLVLRKK